MSGRGPRREEVARFKNGERRFQKETRGEIILKLLKGEHAQAMLVLVSVLALLMLLGAAAATLASGTKLQAVAADHRARAFYIAEAGLERVLAKARDPVWLSDLPGGETVLPDPDVSDCEYAGGRIEEVRISKEGAGPATRLALTSVGTYQTARRTIQAEILVSAAPDLIKGISILPQDPIDLKVTGNFTVSPDAGESRLLFVLSGDLTLTGSSEIHGDVYTSGGITMQGNSTVAGLTCPDYPDVPSFPFLDLEYFRAESQKNGRYYQGNQVFNVGLCSGIYFIEGNLKISGTYQGRAVLVTRGDIEVTGDLKAENRDEDMFVLISARNVDIKNRDVDAVIIAGGSFSVQGNASLYGGLLTRNFSQGQGKGNPPDHVAGHVEIICNPDLIVRNLPREVTRGISASVRVVRWKE